MSSIYLISTATSNEIIGCQSSSFEGKENKFSVASLMTLSESKVEIVLGAFK